MSEEFKVKHASVTQELAARFADELEVMIGQVMNGNRKADRLPVEHMIGLIQFSRCASPSPASDAELPPLPHYAMNFATVYATADERSQYYTADQMREYGQACARAASTRTASDTRTAAGPVECDSALRAEPASQHDASTEALNATRWPFVESPGEFTARLQHLLNEGYPLLGAVRNVLIESPPMFAHPEQTNGAVYGIIDPDYGRIYTMVRKLAWEEGYAIGLHGSFTRDLDLIAVPWDDGRRCDPIKLVRRILQATGLTEAHGNPGTKPHGRLVWTLLLPEFGDPRFVDLSIMSVPAGAAREGGETQSESFAARTQADAGKDTARLNALIDWYRRGGARSEISPSGHIAATTREQVIAWCDAQSSTTKPENT